MKVLRMLFATHGIPDTIVSDNGTGFISQEFKTFLRKNGIRQVNIAPRHPSSTGQIKRMVQTTKEALARMSKHVRDLQLAKFLLSQHITPHVTTGRCPAEMLFNRKLKICLDRLHPDNYTKKEVLLEVEQMLARSSVRWRQFQVADTVGIRGFGVDRKWIPATIVAVSGPVSYVVYTSDGRTGKRHVDQIRRRVDEVVPGDTSAPEIATGAAVVPVIPDQSLRRSRTASTSGSSSTGEEDPPQQLGKTTAGASGEREVEVTQPNRNLERDEGTSGQDRKTSNSRPVRFRRSPVWRKDYV